MPRFQDAHIGLLKRIMLAYVPTCFFSSEDITNIERETGLDAAQIQQWSWNFRSRFAPEEREKVLRRESPNEVEKTQRQRFQVSNFNGTEEMVQNLNVPKARGTGEYAVAYSDFTLNTTTGFVEGLVEFKEKIWSNQLEAHLAGQGAASITIITFAHNDGDRSAGAALARVWKLCKRPEYQRIVRGECSVNLQAKATKLMEEEEAETAASSAEFNEKTMEAMKRSAVETHEIHEQLPKLATKEDLQETLRQQTQMYEASSTQQQQRMATKDDLAALQQTIDKLHADMAGQAQVIAGLQASNAALEASDAALQESNANQAQTIKELEASVNAKDRDIVGQTQVIAGLQASNVNQARTINELEETVKTKDRDNQAYAAKNDSQTYMLRKLNHEKAMDAATIERLNAKVQGQADTIISLGTNTGDRIGVMETKLDALCANQTNTNDKLNALYDLVLEEVIRKRKRDE